jgi:hypothetical protein
MQVKVRKLILFLLFSQLVATSLPGCVPASVEEGGTKIDAAPVNIPAPPGTNPATGTVCNPFGGGSAGRDQGLKGELFYLPGNLPKYQNVSDYIQNGTKLEADLYFDQVNVPTRPFDAGFVTTDGEVMKTPAGDTLYEWFGIRFQSKIRLTNQDAVGKYQFALIADDGAVLLERLPDGSTRTIVNNDGQHATKFRVANQPVELGANDELPIEVRYYQGPRMHIAAMVLWREWPSAANGYKDPLDGREGNDLFFSSNTTPSKPLAAYEQLLARGWRPVPAANFFLPSEVPANPCPEEPTSTATDTNTNTSTETSTSTDTNTTTGPGTSPGSQPEEPSVPSDWSITAFDVTTTADTASLIWSTAGVATSAKVYYGTSAGALNGTLDVSAATSGAHTATVSGLSRATLYYFRVEAKDANGKVVSSGVLQKATK